MTAGPVTAPVVSARRGTIAEALSGRNNALNFVRLVLASLVIVSHAGLAGPEQHRLVGEIGGFAVGGFFAISGYLIAGSRVRLSFGGYLWRRVLRIMPAFWVCLFVVAFAIAPLASAVTGERWSARSAASFVLSNAGLWINQWVIEDTLTQTVSRAWNGPLWTLFYEFAAYIVAGVVLSVPWVRRQAKLSMFGLLTAATVLSLIAGPVLLVTTNLYLNGLELGTFFVAGMLVWAWSSRVPVTGALGVPALVLVAAAWVVGPDAVPQVLIAIPMAYGMLWLGSALPVGLGQRNDISYGIYIYGMPMQQLLAVTGVSAVIGVWFSVVVAFWMATALAATSWWFVEKPAMKLRRLVG